MIECPRCDDGRFVCENHPDKPYFGDRACSCGGAGMACPACNVSEVTAPEMPEVFKEDLAAGDFIKCPECGGWVDSRDLASVMAHAGPLPHPPADRLH